MTTRLFFPLLLCFLALSSQRVQAQHIILNQAILSLAPGTRIVDVQNMIATTPYAGHVRIIDQAFVFGLFLVEFDKIDFKGVDCDSVTNVLRKVCPKCASSTTTSSTGIQGGGLNYRTIIDTASTKKLTIQDEKTWKNTWGHVIDGNYKDGCRVITAFLDTGIDETHSNPTSPSPWFLNTTTDIIPSYDTNPFDNNGHGTHTIGVTAQIVRNCSNIELLSIKTQNADGEGTVWTAIKGIELAIGAAPKQWREPANIINMSLAYWPECKGGQPLATAMRISGERYNVLFVTAAGNQAQSLSPSGSFQVYPSMFNLENQINVAALEDNHTLAAGLGTNYGAECVNIGAFGVGVKSAVLGGDYGHYSGTSAAAPQVTAVASIIASQYCDIDYARIRNCILSTATVNGLPLSTAGYLNPKAAIACEGVEYYTPKREIIIDGKDVAHVESMVSPNGRVVDSANIFGLYLVKFDKIDFEKRSCEEVEKILTEVCPKCPTPMGTRGSSGLNYPTFDQFPKGKTEETGKSEEIWQENWASIIKDGSEYGCPITATFLGGGIDKRHLANTDLGSPFLKTTTATITKYPNPFDKSVEGNGTHFIGTAAQIVKNFPNINLRSIKTQNASGNGTVWSAIKGIERAIIGKEDDKEQWKSSQIISMSLAYQSDCIKKKRKGKFPEEAISIDKEVKASSRRVYEQPLEKAMRISGEKYNVLFVTAAGDQGVNLNKEYLNLYPSMFNLPNQINVGALNERNQLVKANAYDYIEEVDTQIKGAMMIQLPLPVKQRSLYYWGTNYGKKYVHIAALGVQIKSAVRDGKFDVRDGTSTAAAQVAAAASIIASNSCDKISYADIRDCILKTATVRELPLSTAGYLNPQDAIDCSKKDESQGRVVKESIISTYSIYPNPFDEALNIEFVATNEKEVTQCTLYNSTGQIIQKTNYQGNINSSWNVQDLPKGVYLLKIQHGTTQEVQKLIKQ